MIWNVSKTGTGKSELSGNGKLLISCLVLAMVALITPTLAQAQSNSEVRALVDRINRLEQDITDMQRTVYSGATPAPRPAPSSSSTLPATSGGSVSQDGLALLLQRISALEDEQRRLTGAQEEASFKINQMTTRLDKLVKDVDFRLTDIERRLGTPGGAPGAPATTGAIGSPTPLAGSGTSPTGTTGSTASTGPEARRRSEPGRRKQGPRDSSRER